MRLQYFQQHLSHFKDYCLKEIHQEDWPGYQAGKVRDSYDFPNGERIIITTDRQSAHDKLWGFVPFKGMVLTKLSEFWFKATQDLCANHFIDCLDPNVMRVKRVTMLPVEIVVRGYLTGATATSIWQRYQNGERLFADLELPDGLAKNDPLPKVILTPTTKAVDGHDQNATAEELIISGVLSQQQWQRLLELSLRLFQRGQQIAAQQGFILVDTKYEFGLDENNTIVLADEIHTPDSSRFWLQSSYQSDPTNPDMYDKELLRLCINALNEKNDLQLDAVLLELAARYLTLYEAITGDEIDLKALCQRDPVKRIEQCINAYKLSNS